jgi:hypothetical protein
VVLESVLVELIHNMSYKQTTITGEGVFLFPATAYDSAFKAEYLGNVTIN